MLWCQNALRVDQLKSLTKALDHLLTGEMVQFLTAQSPASGCWHVLDMPLSTTYPKVSFAVRRSG